MQLITSLCPLLVVRGAAQAIDFYQRALGAQLLARFEHGTERRISHADLALGDARFSLTEELRAFNSQAPVSLGGSAVVLQLGVADATAALDALRAAGASIVFPLQPFAGELMARVRDPFGHLWIVRQLVEPLSVAEIQRRRDELFADLAPPPTREAPTIEPASPSAQAPHAAPRHEPRTARVHLVIGPVGAGKSTFARSLTRERSAVCLTLDDWMATLFSPDRPETGLLAWYVERAQRCVEQIWSITRQLAARGDEVVLEIGMIRRDERQRFYARVSDAGLPLTIHVIDASRDTRRTRVLERNRSRPSTFSMVVPAEIFELASDLWQEPEPEEHEGRDVRFLRTDAGGT